jgi:hypothetical protein
MVYSDENAAGKPFDCVLKWDEYVIMRTGG